MIFSPNYDTGSYGKAGNSEACELNIETHINIHHHSLTTFKQITHEDNISRGGLCLLDRLTGSGDEKVDGNCKRAKVQSGVQGITLKLNNQSQHQPSFHIKYEGN